MKEQLFKLYSSRQSDFKKLLDHFQGDDLAGPFLMSPNNKYSSQPNPLLIVGQETNGWEYHVSDVQKQMSVYEQFNLGEEYYASPFWNMTRKIEHAINNEQYSCGWTNISKFDVDGGRAYGEYETEISKLDNLLIGELDILKPKIVLFFTGPSFDNRIKKIFSEIEYKPVDGFSEREICQLQHSQLPENTYRTYHPNYLRRSGLEPKIISFIKSVL